MLPLPAAQPTSSWLVAALTQRRDAPFPAPPGSPRANGLHWWGRGKQLSPASPKAKTEGHDEAWEPRLLVVEGAHLVLVDASGTHGCVSTRLHMRDDVELIQWARPDEDEGALPFMLRVTCCAHVHGPPRLVILPFDEQDVRAVALALLRARRGTAVLEHARIGCGKLFKVRVNSSSTEVTALLGTAGPQGQPRDTLFLGLAHDRLTLLSKPVGLPQDGTDLHRVLPSRHYLDIRRITFSTNLLHGESTRWMRLEFASAFKAEGALREEWNVQCHRRADDVHAVLLLLGRVAFHERVAVCGGAPGPAAVAELPDPYAAATATLPSNVVDRIDEYMPLAGFLGREQGWLARSVDGDALGPDPTKPIGPRIPRASAASGRSRLLRFLFPVAGCCAGGPNPSHSVPNVTNSRAAGSSGEDRAGGRPARHVPGAPKNAETVDEDDELLDQRRLIAQRLTWRLDRFLLRRYLARWKAVAAALELEDAREHLAILMKSSSGKRRAQSARRGNQPSPGAQGMRSPGTEATRGRESKERHLQAETNLERELAKVIAHGRAAMRRIAELDGQEPADVVPPPLPPATP